MIVAKFGGTSVKDANALKRVLQIVAGLISDKKSVIVVLSACSGYTDKLLNLVKTAPKDGLAKCKFIIDEIGTFHINLCNKLIANENIRKTAVDEIRKLIDELATFIEGVCLLEEVTPRSADRAVSYGELLSTTVFHHAAIDKGMNSSFWDARTFMKTDTEFNSANLNFDLTNELITIRKNSFYGNNEIAVTQGFIASDNEERTTTLGRGGSDYSAAVIGAVVKVDEIQIWTDVTGVLSADPKLVPEAVTVPEMSYNEIRLLSFFGAKVLHPDTIKPAVEAEVPIRILNTFLPELPGTLILKSVNHTDQSFNSIVCREKCLLLTFRLPVNEDPEQYNNYINKITSELNIKLYYSDRTDISLRFIIENINSKDLINKLSRKSEFFETKIVDLIYVSGGNNVSNEYGKSSMAENISNELIKRNCISLNYTLDPLSILAILPQEMGLTALRKIHKIITTLSE